MSSIGDLQLTSHETLYASDGNSIAKAIEYESNRRKLDVTVITFEIGESFDDEKFNTVIHNLKNISSVNDLNIAEGSHPTVKDIQLIIDKIKTAWKVNLNTNPIS